MLSGRNSARTRITPAVLELSGNLCTCGWVGAIVASSYFAYVAVAGTSAWSNVFLSLAVAFVAKCLAVALNDLKSRAVYVENGPAPNNYGREPTTYQRQATTGLAQNNCADDLAVTVPNLSVPDPITSKGDKEGWNDGAYQVGFTLGKHWARRDGNSDKVSHLKTIGDGTKWVESHHKGPNGLTKTFDPQEIDAIDADKDPSPSFLAGFIDGAQEPES